MRDGWFRFSNKPPPYLKMLDNTFGNCAPNAPRTFSVGFVNVICGKNVTVVQPSNIYGCSIGDDVFVGPFVEIQKDVVIGARTRVQSHTFICELVTIGQDCFIGHGVMFINDRFSKGGPARGDRTLWCRTSIGNSVSIGSNATIMPVSICEGVVIGAGSVVTRDILVPGVYAGNPARLLLR
jgi:acetyltransferase-like isoleucine patch superfamily enzyme